MGKRNFKVYFEIYGKKMKTTIQADTEAEAKDIIRNKIIFHKVVSEPLNDKDAFNFLFEIVNGKK